MLMRPYRYAAAGGFTNTYSLNFDGVNEYISLPSTPSALVSATNFSVSFWIKYTTNDQGSPFEFRTAVSDEYRCFINNSTLRFSVGNGGTSYGQYSFGTSANWRHVACVYDGGGSLNTDKLKVYVDGSNQTLSFTGTIPSSTSSTSSHTYENIASTTGSAFLLCKLDEMAIYDYTLSSSNVTTIYNSGAVYDLDLLSTPPVHWWRMGDGSDTISTIYDVGTSASINGTPQNMESGDIQTDVV